jgi:hypothetical protein
MMTLMNNPFKIDFRYGKGKLAIDTRRSSGQEVQEQKDELIMRIDKRIQTVSNFRVRLEAAGAPVQQSVGCGAQRCDRGKGSTRCRDEPDAEAADGRASYEGSTRSLRATNEVSKKRQHADGKVKVLRLQELIGNLLGQTEGVNINFSETEESVESCVGLLERAALELAETKDWSLRVESDGVGLRTAMADGITRVKEVQ